MSVTLNDAAFPGHAEEAGLLTRLRRRKLLFASVLVLASGSVGLVYCLLPPTYRATGAVIVTADDSQVSGAESPAAAMKLGDPADMDSQTVIAKSPRVVRAMLQQPQLLRALHEDCEATQRAMVLNRIAALIRPSPSCDSLLAGAGAVDWLTQNVMVGAVGRSRVIQIFYASPAPAAAATLVNGLIDTYLAQSVADRRRARADAEAWIQSELARLGAELRQSEIAIEHFRRDHGLVRGQSASIVSERLSQVGQKLASAQATYFDSEARLQQMQNGAADAHETLDSRTVGDLKQQLSGIAAEIARDASIYGADYPGLMALRQQRADLQRRIAEETERVRSSVGRDYASAAAQVNSLSKQLDALKQDVGVGDLAETQIASMVRDTEVKRELYVDLSKKANELEAQRRLLTGDVQLVNYAEVPDRIVSPKLSLFAMAGLLVGTVLAGGAAVLRDRADASARSSRRLEAISGVPVLGYIPFVPRLHLGYAAAAQAKIAEPSALQEAVRSLYTRSFLLHGSARPRTAMVTSASPGEGKSFLTLALAQFAAATGARVLAVEADLRRPGFRTALGLPGAPGLLDILQARVAPADAVRPTRYGYDVVSAGAASVASTELLSNGRFKPFLNWARERYHLVLIDSPPAQTLMDTQVLAGQVDAILHCVRWGHSSVETVTESVRSLRQAGGRVAGLVFGQVQPREYRLYEPERLLGGPYLGHSG